MLSGVWGKTRFSVALLISSQSEVTGELGVRFRRWPSIGGRDAIILQCCEGVMGVKLYLLSSGSTLFPRKCYITSKYNHLYYNPTDKFLKKSVKSWRNGRRVGAGSE